MVTIGFSGLSSCGKTTVAKALLNILPGLQLIHQDDFYFPPEKIPYDEILKEQNWDSPESLDFDKFIETLQKLHGNEPGFKYKVDSLEIDETNEKTRLTADQIKILAEKVKPHAGRLSNLYLIDGFMLYTNEQVMNNLDLKLFFKAPYEECKARRAARQGYNVIGGFWVDPPNYFDKFVWPSYYKAHKHLFINGQDEDYVKKTGGDLNEIAEKLGLKEFNNPNNQILFDLVNETLDYIISST